jgi:hypothetical protein
MYLINGVYFSIIFSRREERLRSGIGTSKSG